MQLNKQDILNILEKYIIISGAALVLQGVKPSTNDIDLAVDEKLYSKLLKEYDCVFEKNQGGYEVWFIDDVINFSNNYYETVQNIEYLGYRVQTVESVLNLKESLNRPKDKTDIQMIRNFNNKNKC